MVHGYSFTATFTKTQFRNTHSGDSPNVFLRLHLADGRTMLFTPWLADRPYRDKRPDFWLIQGPGRFGLHQPPSDYSGTLRWIPGNSWAGVLWPISAEERGRIERTINRDMSSELLSRVKQRIKAQVPKPELMVSGGAFRSFGESRGWQPNWLSLILNSIEQHHTKNVRDDLEPKFRVYHDEAGVLWFDVFGVVAHLNRGGYLRKIGPKAKELLRAFLQDEIESRERHENL